MLRRAATTLASSSSKGRRLALPTTIGVATLTGSVLYLGTTPTFQKKNYAGRFPNYSSSSSASSTTACNAEPSSTIQQSSLSSTPSSSTTSKITIKKATPPPSQNENTLTKIRPLYEASIRALRLLQTVSLIILDYRTEHYHEQFQTKLAALTLLVQLPLTSPDALAVSTNNTTTTTKKQLEDKVRMGTDRLQQAQERYSSNDGSNDAEVRRQEVHDAARYLGQAEDALLSHRQQEEQQQADSTTTTTTSTHERAAKRLLTLCRQNGGAYIKVGQHLANLDHLLPTEYITILSSLYSSTPPSSYEDVREVLLEELGGYPEDVFPGGFEEVPVASASLAQVHVAWLEKEEEGGGGKRKKLAVKVQHRGLRDTVVGDLVALEAVVRFVDWGWDEFRWGWIVDEIAPNLPKELDFCHEGKNAEKAAAHIQSAGLDCIVPKVHWNHTTSRVLCMDYEEGFAATDVEEVERAGLKKSDLATLISSVFQSQIFQSGFIHCDPHPANVLWRPKANGKPQLVLVDHGLYKEISDDFRLTYAQLWKSLLTADINGIKKSCGTLGVYDMYPLLAAMLTSRPFDEILERSKTQTFSAQSPPGMDSNSDKAMIRGYAQQYLREIIQMLDKVPREMLLLFKMNDCLRHIDHALGVRSVNTLVIAGKYAAGTIYREEDRCLRNDCDRGVISNSSSVGRIVMRWKAWLSYVHVLYRIRLYEMVSWYSSRKIT